MKTKIRFVNHASVVLECDGINILTDPWFHGSVFDNGWKLIYENSKNDIKDIINNIQYIYISHEHPDHFSPNFFLDHEFKNILLNKKVKILFQETLDKRIVNFFKKNGLETIEIKANKALQINKNLEINIVKFGYIDSALIVKSFNHKILNLNDSPLNKDSEIYKFKKKYGTFDTLLTQFSYAAWKGGKNNYNFRKQAALEKLETIKKQSNILECSSVIPFASFIYFSNEMNKYMNDNINNPEDVYKKMISEKNIVFLSPGETQPVNDLKQKKESLDFWGKEFSSINEKKFERYNTTISYNELEKLYNKYKKNIFNLNSKFIIKTLSKIKFLNFFQDLNIRLVDHMKNYKFSLFNGFRESESKVVDIYMHSQSLSFILKNNFGFDTLTVNCCFESSKEGFIKSTKSLAIGSLNSMGIYLNFKLIFKTQIIFFFFRLIKKVSNKLN